MRVVAEAASVVAVMCESMCMYVCMYICMYVRTKEQQGRPVAGQTVQK